MKKLIAETLRDTRVVAVSVLASGLLLGGTVVSAQNVAFQPARAAAAPGQVLKGDYSLGGATDGNACLLYTSRGVDRRSSPPRR